MHDTEPDTIVLQSWPERFAGMLSEIGVGAEPLNIGEGPVERDDYYSRYFSQTPRMVTNKGSLKVKETNIDMVQIIQKG